MPENESKEVSEVPKPAVPPEKIGEHKTPEVDALPTTPDRKAKTGEK